MEPADERRETMAHYETINLSRIASNVEPEMVDEADVLAPGSGIEAIIVEGDEIVDGYHRAAGYMAWAGATASTVRSECARAGGG